MLTRLRPLFAIALVLAVAACAGRQAVMPKRTGAPAQPGSLMGKGPAALRAMLGEPSLLRRDQGAEVWQYAGQSCVLFLYLYPDAAGAPAVSYVDARLKTKGAAPVPDCLSEVRRAR